MKIAAVLLFFLTTFQILGHGFGPDTYVKIFSKNRITFDQAYEAMVKFLDDYATLTNSKDLKLLLSDMHKSNDSDNWNEIVSQVISKPITPDFVLYKP